MWIFWIALIVLVIWIVKAGMARTGTGDGGDNQPSSPLDILKQRYARGEIDHDEYERKRKDLIR